VRCASTVAGGSDHLFNCSAGWDGKICSAACFYLNYFLAVCAATHCVLCRPKFVGESILSPYSWCSKFTWTGTASPLPFRECVCDGSRDINLRGNLILSIVCLQFNSTTTNNKCFATLLTLYTVHESVRISSPRFAHLHHGEQRSFDTAAQILRRRRSCDGATAQLTYTYICTIACLAHYTYICTLVHCCLLSSDPLLLLLGPLFTYTTT